MWVRGYVCASVGEFDKEQIAAYIEHHEKEPIEENFSVDDEEA